jgi:hypothetical protein
VRIPAGTVQAFWENSSGRYLFPFQRLADRASLLCIQKLNPKYRITEYTENQRRSFPSTGSEV